MPWKETTVLTQRKEFVQLARQSTIPMRDLCQRFGISRKTGYKWLRRWRAAGDAGLQDRSRRPHHSPQRTPADVEEQVLAVHDRYQAWGSRKLRARMQRMVQEGKLPLRPEQIPAASTILRILKRHGQWQPPVYGHGNGAATQRFERAAPNQLWQLDFKGDFRLSNGQRCYPLTCIDDHSRFNIGLRACGNMHRETVQTALTQIFRRYGLPEAILVDHGPPWGSGLRPRPDWPYYTALSLWLLRLGIRLPHSRPRHPQTHGKNERFNGTLKAELLRYETFRDLLHAQERFDWWRTRYNQERPHQALADQVPLDRYRPSPRPFPATLPPIEYGPDDAVRKVDASGTISFRGCRRKIGTAFRGYHVAVRPQHNSPKYLVYFCQQPVKEIAVEKAA